MACEGVNAQISVPGANLRGLRDFLEAEPGFAALRLNMAVEDRSRSFFVLDIKVREKIVADGIADPGFDMANKGRYVDARQFNQLTEDPDTVVVDMRNYYEYEVGHFQRAVEVPSDTFREQLPMAVDMLSENKDRNIIMYCTGGIRCEKASAWMLHQGFRNVFHLEGGIINYVKQVREQGLENKFIGKNFVFDERLGERISPDVIAHCHTCRSALEGCCSEACRSYTHLSPEAQAEWRKQHAVKGTMHNKSRARLQSLRRKIP